MTDEHPTDDGDAVLTLQALISARKSERGWSFGDLAARSDDRLTRGRWQQLASGERIKNFPEPDSLRLIADAIEVDVTTVLLATAQSLGIDARRRGPDLAHLLPAGTDRLSERMRDAILTIIRAAVAETLSNDPDDGDDGDVDLSLEWTKSEPPTRRNTRGRTSDSSS